MDAQESYGTTTLHAKTLVSYSMKEAKTYTIYIGFLESAPTIFWSESEPRHTPLTDSPTRTILSDPLTLPGMVRNTNTSHKAQQVLNNKVT